MNTNKLVKEFKKYYETATGEKLDFRSVVYNINSYGFYPSGNITELTVVMLYSWANTFVEQNKDILDGFQGFVFNTEIALRELESMKFKDKVESVCETIANHFE